MRQKRKRHDWSEREIVASELHMLDLTEQLQQHQHHNHSTNNNLSDQPQLHPESMEFEPILPSHVELEDGSLHDDSNCSDQKHISFSLPPLRRQSGLPPAIESLPEKARAIVPYEPTVVNGNYLLPSSSSQNAHFDAHNIMHSTSDNDSAMEVEPVDAPV
jgi:hypothetical protein